MRRSLNEVETGLRKAALGAGWPQGMAEDIGRAAMVMCGSGGDGVGALLGLLSGSQDPQETGLANIITTLDLLGAGVISQARLRGVDIELVRAFASSAGQVQDCGYVLDETAAGVAVRLDAPPKIKPTKIELSNGAEVDEADWQKVLALVQKTFVPASEGSRLQGAGAGMTDND